MGNANQYHGDFSLVAAEFSLGLLTPEERAGAEDEYARNATFRALVAEWDDYFAPLSASYGLTEAPDVWPDLQKEMFAKQERLETIVANITTMVPVLVGFKLSLLFMLLAVLLRR